MGWLKTIKAENYVGDDSDSGRDTTSVSAATPWGQKKNRKREKFVEKGNLGTVLGELTFLLGLAPFGKRVDIA